MPRLKLSHQLCQKAEVKIAQMLLCRPSCRIVSLWKWANQFTFLWIIIKGSYLSLLESHIIINILFFELFIIYIKFEIVSLLLAMMNNWKGNKLYFTDSLPHKNIQHCKSNSDSGKGVRVLVHSACNDDIHFS